MPAASSSFSLNSPNGVPGVCTGELNGIGSNGYSNGANGKDIYKNGDDVPNRATEANAIIGMSCRLPGKCSSPGKLWDLLTEGGCPQSRVPENRFNIDAFYHPKRGRPGTMKADGGFFISEDVRQFDPTFFGISANEAITMDPQQRKILEVAYEALESAGVPLSQVHGSNTGCFVANFTQDFGTMQYRDLEFGTSQNYLLTGTGLAIMSNRVSYAFNLKGPSLTLDTACSSSVYALHLACQSLADGSCDAALVIGTNLILTPEQFLASDTLGVLSPTSKCHTFDISADGYARAEGISALYIKRHSDAIQNNDPVRAVIRGTAFNSNGKAPGGLTNPSPIGQEAVIRSAYQRAGDIDFSQTGYFECHGTGTYVGDPLEVAAIGKVFAETRCTGSPLLIGSVKTNLGHAESSSGITSIIKCVLALESGIIPPTIGFKTPNPNIDFKDGRLKVVTENTPWPDGLPGGARITSINSFGYGGANGHVILQDAESFVKPARPATLARRLTITDKFRSQRSQFLLLFSAHDEDTLKKNVQKLALEADKHNTIDLAYTLGTRRSRLYIGGYCITSVNQKATMTTLLETMSTGKRLARSPTISMVFTGQGAQWAGMGAEILFNFPSALETIRYMDSVLQTLPTEDRPSWTLEYVLLDLRSPESSKINDVEQAQPICTAVQIMLVQLLSQWNIKPVATVGHSSGEIAAAYVANLLSMDDAIKIAYYRGLHVARLTQKGAMLAVGLAPDEVQKYKPFDSRCIRVACVNSPKSITVSGDLAEVEQLAAELDAAGVFNRILKTGGRAYHSHHMAIVGQDYEASLKETLTSSGPNYNTTSSTPAATMFSSVTAKRVKHKKLGPEYWRMNLESPVLFSQALSGLLTSPEVSADYLIEIGPHSALQAPIKQLKENLEMKFSYASALVRGQDSVNTMLKLAGNLTVVGYPVDIERVNAVEMPDGTSRMGRTLVSLPTYQWNYSKLYWNESRWSIESRQRKHARHDVLGSQILGADRTNPSWRNILRLKDLAWLEDHKAGGAIVFPAMGYVASAAEAALQLYHDDDGHSTTGKGFKISNLTILQALVIPESDLGVEMVTSLRQLVINNHKTSDVWYEFTISSSNSNQWTKHCTGRVRIISDTKSVPALHDKQSHSFRKAGDSRTWYSKFKTLGLEYGPMFQGLSDITADPHRNESKSRIPWRIFHDSMESRYFVHPSTMDVCIHSVFIPAFGAKVHDMDKVYLPVGIEEITCAPLRNSFAPKDVILNNKAKLSGFKTLLASTQALDSESQNVLLSMEGIRCLALNHQTQGEAVAGVNSRTPFLKMTWKPDITTLSPQQAIDIFPGRKDAGLRQLFDDWNTLCILCLYQTIPKISTVADEFHLRHFFSWMKDRVSEVETGQSHLSKTVAAIPATNREGEIERLFENLKDEIYESRLLRAMYHSYRQILMGEKGGHEPLLEDGMLDHVYVEGIRSRVAYDQLSRLLDLCGHKNPDLRIVEIGAGTGGASEPALEALEGRSIFRKYQEYVYTDITPAFLAGSKKKFAEFHGMTFKTLDIENDPVQQGYEAHSFDIVLSANCFHATKDLDAALTHAHKLLKPGGHLILLELTKDIYGATMIWGGLESYWHGARTDGRTYNPFLSKKDWLEGFVRNGFASNVIALDDFEDAPEPTTVFFATAQAPTINNSVPVGKLPSDTQICLLHRNYSPQLSTALTSSAQARGLETIAMSILEYQKLETKPDNVIALLDLEGSAFLNTMNEAEFIGLQELVRCANKLIWINPGGIQSTSKPEFGMLYGWARTIAFENPLAEFITIDINMEVQKNDHERVVDIFTQTFTDRLIREREIGLQGGITYITRMTENQVMNEKFIEEELMIAGPMEVQYDPKKPTSLHMVQPGLLDTFYFKDDNSMQTPLEDDEVLIEVEYSGLAFKGVMVAMGQFDDEGLNWEYSGTVNRVGSGISSIKKGDRVVGLCISRFNRYVRVKEALVAKVDAHMTFEQLATMPVVFVTAIHALSHLANLHQSDKILIQSASGATGQACIQLAKSIGAEIFATVGSEAKKTFLMSEYGIPADHIFGSRDVQFIEDILHATGGKGIDVIIATSSGEILLDSFKCLGHFGRFVEIGRSDIYEHGSLDLISLRNNVSFYSFDISLTIAEHPESCSLIKRHLETMVDLIGLGKIKPITPILSFHVTEIASAIRAFSQRNEGGKIVVQYGEQLTPKPVKAKVQPRSIKFDSQGSYLLIGCLSGLGLSIAEFMAERGAKSLIFLSRSGDSKPEAAALVSQLRQDGVEAHVVVGDASVLEDVKRAVAVTLRPIKGMIQSAMVLRDNLFNNMSLSAFQSAVAPKVQATANLHNILLETGQPLDFFFMLSSVAGYIGHTAQSNYAAGNTYQDALARHRHQLGLPATSLALGIIEEIGYVSERDGVAAGLARHGMTSSNEHEFLQLVENALLAPSIASSQTPRFQIYEDKASDNYIITGMEPAKITTDGAWMRSRLGFDPRSSIWLSAINEIRQADNGGGRSAGNDQATLQLANIKEWLLADNPEGFRLLLEAIRKQLAVLLLLDIEQVENERAIADYGLDSMVGAEFRNWIMGWLGVQVGFLELVEPGCTIIEFGNRVVRRLKNSV